MVFYGLVTDGKFSKDLGIYRDSTNLDDAYDLCKKPSSNLASGD